MTVVRRVFVSIPADVWLTPEQNGLKWAIVERIESLGFVAEIFFDPTGRESLAAGRAWNADAAEEIMRQCVGAAIIGLPRWTFESDGGPIHFPTEYCHYEGALARTIGLPLLVLAERGLMRRVVFDDSFGPHIGEFARDVGRSWLDTNHFEIPFELWRRQVAERRDIFLGYCSAASDLADRMLALLESDLGATVLDWRRDFKPGRSILEEIEEARTRCTTGVFLFTKDDLLSDGASGATASPRDNVVFEAGYFASAKGKKRVLIVRESGTRLPADLGGDIYASLEDRTDLAGAEPILRSFLTTL